MGNKHNLIENELVILTKQTLDIFLKQKNPADCIALYVFYYYTAKWQKTNQPKATDGYCKRGLSFGAKRLIDTKKVLTDLGLIETVNTRDEKGKINGWYIKINYIITQNKCSQSIQNSPYPLVGSSTSGYQETNALNTNNINALSSGKERPKKSKKKKELKPFEKLSYFENITQEDIKEFKGKYDVNTCDIMTKADSMLNYCKSSGRVYKNYKAALRNALSKDFGLKKFK